MFWLIYLSIALVAMIILIVMLYFGSLLTCAVLGGFIIVLTIAYFANTNFVYIIINVIRRLTVSSFNYAIISYPLQSAGKRSFISFFLFVLTIEIWKKKNTRKYWSTFVSYFLLSRHDLDRVLGFTGRNSYLQWRHFWMFVLDNVSTWL